MDEKGIQLGGGRKGTGLKYIIPRGQKSSFMTASGDLELVTIIECVCADGSNVPPGFVFEGQKFKREWFKQELKDQVGRCELRLFHSFCSDHYLL